MVIEQLNPQACRTYLIGEEGGEEVALVDPVLEHVNDYLRLLEERGLKLTHVIDTHTHADHISGAAALRDRRDCEHVMAEKEREIVTVCRSGARAHTAAQIMTQAGFGRVRVLAGGMKAWREAGYPVETK